MRAQVGDRLRVPPRQADEPGRDGEVLEVRGRDGAPPYVVRWEPDGHRSLYFPPADAWLSRSVVPVEPG